MIKKLPIPGIENINSITNEPVTNPAVKGPSSELIGKIERQIPARSLADVGDVANAILFLASDESKLITGSELVIDGGLSAQ